MTVAERRTQILNEIKNSRGPVPGSRLAEQYAVSRQVIVQDIALIRAAGHAILSTNRGYLLQAPVMAQREFQVNHTDEELEAELLTIVDLGGKVVNVTIQHKVYGRLEAPLGIASRRQVMDFLGEIREGKSRPLKNITGNDHSHLIEADSQETLDLIEQALRAQGILVSGSEVQDDP